MGLLDDAIREHLELKRRRGADPGEVAREQREALDSAAGGSVAASPALTQTAHAATAGETAELDMSSVLDDDGDAEDLSALPCEAGTEAGERARASTQPVAARSNTEEDSLEWE